MKYILTILILALVFIAGCGDEKTESEDTTDNISMEEDVPVEEDIAKDEPLGCLYDEVEIDGKCVLKEDIEDSETIVEEEVAEVEEPVVQEGNVKKFVITADNYNFWVNGVENPDLRVKKGDKVVIEFTSIEGSHSWNVAKLAARSRTVSTNESTTLEFNATAIGTFDYYCAVGRHQNIGQEGKFIVE